MVKKKSKPGVPLPEAVREHVGRRRRSKAQQVAWRSLAQSVQKAGQPHQVQRKQLPRRVK